MNDASRLERLALPGHWMGWRLRGLVVVALAACLVTFALMRWIAATPHLPLDWQLDDRGAVVVHDASRSDAVLRSIRIGRQSWPVDATMLAFAPRWQVQASTRASTISLNEAIESRHASAELTFADGTRRDVAIVPRGFAGLGWPFWPLATLALAVLLVGAVVALSRPHVANLMYLGITGCQFVGLLLLAVSLSPGAGIPVPLAALDAPLRMSVDLAAAAMAAHALSVYPQRTRRVRWLAWAAWIAASAAVATAWLPSPPWSVLHAAVLALCAAGIGVAAAQLRSAPNPVLGLVCRLLVIGWLLAAASAALVALAQAEMAPLTAARAGPIVWSLLPALLLMAPLMMRSRQALREFALLAGISTVAAAMDLLFVTVFSLGSFASLTLVVFIALAVYAWARQWLFDRMLASHALTTERIFDQLYRAAREVQARPERYAAQLAALLRDLFEPLEVAHAPRELQRSRVAGGGSSLLVPMLALPDGSRDGSPRGTLVLHFARRGRRIFTREDARLADRVVEQLRRAVAYDLAVERGRSEERARIAQDLHDDIGARLLTLMYQAPNAEMEDYVRHTLKDLKTLTRGLAAGEQRWSHAVAEWKADIAQRLGAARVELDWHAAHDEDVRLSVVQWSALTRVLRELVSNAIHHARASQVRVRIELLNGRATLSVADDGHGVDPASWAQGLGLGGVKKRIKMLGGEVQWRVVEPQGIVCEASVAGLGPSG